MYNIFLSIGGNIGNKQANFKQVKDLIVKNLGTIIKASSIYESPPWGFESSHTFWNQVVQIESILPPNELLENAKKIEKHFGRERKSQTYTSRQMDIDILYYEDLILQTDELTIPHPLLHKRNFVLVPLTEVAPEFIHPLLKLTSKKNGKYLSG